MSAVFSVQKGVPLPEINRVPKGATRKYQLEGMEVGDMFFVPGRSVKSVSAYISRISKGMKAKYSARHCWMVPIGMKGGQRVWQLADQSADGAEEGAGVWRIE